MNKGELLMKGLAFASMWISTAIAIIAGLYFTKSADCLWAFVIPMLTTIWM